MAPWAVDLLAGARVSDDSSAWVEAFYPKQAPKRAPGESSDASVASTRMPAELGVLLRQRGMPPRRRGFGLGDNRIRSVLFGNRIIKTSNAIV